MICFPKTDKMLSQRLILINSSSEAFSSEPLEDSLKDLSESLGETSESSLINLLPFFFENVFRFF